MIYFLIDLNDMKGFGMDSNVNLLSIQQAATLLGVSVSTIRRWSEEGIIDCYRVGKAGYRKFDKNKVVELQHKFYGEKGMDNIDEDHRVIEKSINAEAHPAHYLMHKYWGRKAHNIVAEYISFYTKEGDTILEPFMGSGVTVIEAVKQKRQVIGIDINPMSKFIVDNTLSNVDVAQFNNEYSRIVEKIHKEYGYLYETKCDKCNELIKVKIPMKYCNNCGAKMAQESEG